MRNYFPSLDICISLEQSLIVPARFMGNLYCYLPYPVTTQTTTVVLASR